MALDSVLRNLKQAIGSVLPRRLEESQPMPCHWCGQASSKGKPVCDPCDDLYNLIHSDRPRARRMLAHVLADNKTYNSAIVLTIEYDRAAWKSHADLLDSVTVQLRGRHQIPIQARYLIQREGKTAIVLCTSDSNDRR